MPASLPTPAKHILFSPFDLDLRAGQLRCAGSLVALRPKTFSVLVHLAEHPGELITKQALLDAVWGNVAVTEDVVRMSIGELRAVLGDARSDPRFIETVARRGYRFVATLGEATGPAIAHAGDQDAVVVGRGSERAELLAWMGAAMSGSRQVGFVTGEAGIGKTTLVELALRELRRAPERRLRLACGQCVEQYGGGEPYMPVLEALAGLCRGPDGPAVEATLREHAPGWVLRATSMRTAGVGGDEPVGGTHEYTLHRLAVCLEALASDVPLALVIEDMHWSDYATLDLVSLLAHRRHPARLLVLCTLRQADAIVRGHPVVKVKRELVRTGSCRELALSGLPAADVEQYAAARFAGAELPVELVTLLVQRSEGSPFFMTALVQHLIDRGLVVKNGPRWELGEPIESLQAATPDGLRALIEPRLDRLPPDELRVLEAASVAGPEFAAHALVATARPGSGLHDVERVEQVCDGLVRQGEILSDRGEGTWPNGETSARYAFRHVLFQEVVYRRLPPSTRRRLHQTMGEGLETAYAGRTGEVASALAAHFERSGDVPRAIRYHKESAASASARYAYHEARLHLAAALAGVRSQAESPERLAQEATLQEGLGWALVFLEGWGAQEAAAAFTRVSALADRLDKPLVRFRAMDALLTIHTMRAEYTTVRSLGEQVMALVTQLGDPLLGVAVHPTIGAALLHLGDLAGACAHGERGRALIDTTQPSLGGASTGLLLAAAYAYQGQVARAQALISEVVTHAATVPIPYFRAHAMTYAAAAGHSLRDVARTKALADEAIRIAAEWGFSVLRAAATMFRSWCAVQEGRVDEGLAALRAAFHDYTMSGQRISTTSYSTQLVEAYLAAGDIAAATAALDAALAFVAETGERLNEHELHRLKGECALASAQAGGKAEAARHFERAIAIAADASALLSELRATASLCRIGRRPARDRLSLLLARFGSDDDCADVRAARALL
jgi:DNA-binding winged helix-turn-helix (wHTH) protein/tetratricopeptide (TPR) repeat protein